MSRRSKPDALGRVGATWASPSDYGTAPLLLVPLGVIGWVAVAVIPAEVLAAPGVELGKVASISAACGVILRAAGEEVFFRGLLGWLRHRTGSFLPGTLTHAVVNLASVLFVG